MSAPGTASARETSLEAPDAPAKASDALQASAPGSPPPTVTSSTAQPGSDADGASPRRATSGPLGLYAAPATGGTGPQNGSDSSIPKALASAEADAAYSPAPAGSAGIAGIAGMNTTAMTNGSSLQQKPLAGGRPVGVPSLSALPSLGDNPSGLTGAGGAGMGEEEEEEEEERQRREEQRAASALLRQQRRMSAGADESGVFSLETRIAHENRRQDAGGQLV